MQRGRRMAFDYGDVRIGVAVSDPDSIIISPLKALKAQDESLPTQLTALFAEYEPILLVVGEPKHLSGAPSAKMDSIAVFVELLRQITPVPIHSVDERLSTVSAAGKLRSSGRDARSSKDLIDSAAAAEILEAAINIERNRT